MKIQKDISVGQFSWLNAKIYQNRGGRNGILYFPETKEELKEAVVNIQDSGKPVFVFGHTSNCYFLPSFSADAAISTRYLMQYEIQADKVVCQPGAHVK